MSTFRETDMYLILWFKVYWHVQTILLAISVFLIGKQYRSKFVMIILRYRKAKPMAQSDWGQSAVHKNYENHLANAIHISTTRANRFSISHAFSVLKRYSEIPVWIRGDVRTFVFIHPETWSAISQYAYQLSKMNLGNQRTSASVYKTESCSSWDQ